MQLGIIQDGRNRWLHLKRRGFVGNRIKILQLKRCGTLQDFYVGHHSMNDRIEEITTAIQEAWTKYGTETKDPPKRIGGPLGSADD